MGKDGSDIQERKGVSCTSDGKPIITKVERWE